MTNFTICYTVINFETGAQERMEKTFISADNTRAYIAMLNKCDDVLRIDVINGMTGEILDEFDVSTSEPESKVVPSERWEQNSDGTWSFQCRGINCDNCPYKFYCKDTERVSYKVMMDVIQAHGDVHE